MCRRASFTPDGGNGQPVGAGVPVDVTKFQPAWDASIQSAQKALPPRLKAIGIVQYGERAAYRELYAISRASLGKYYQHQIEGEISIPDIVKAPTAVPDPLKHEGFVYYGLSGGKELNLEVRMSSSPTVFTGSQKAKFVEMKGAVAIYQIERTGDIANMLGETQDVQVDARKMQEGM